MFLIFVLWSKTNKYKSTKIFPPLLLKPTYICVLAMPRPKERSVKAPIFKKTTVLCPSKSYYSMTNLGAMVSGHSSSGTLEHSAHFMQPYKPADSLLPRNTWPRNKLFCLPERPDGISSNQHHYKYCCVLKRSFADTDWKIQGCRKGARSLLYKDNFLPIQKNSNESVHSFLVIEEVRGQLHTVIRKGLKTKTDKYKSFKNRE